jgi:hypothetical protein
MDTSHAQILAGENEKLVAGGHRNSFQGYQLSRNTIRQQDDEQEQCAPSDMIVALKFIHLLHTGNPFSQLIRGDGVNDILATDDT